MTAYVHVDGHQNLGIVFKREYLGRG